MLADVMRPEAPQVVSELRALDLRPALLSGDGTAPVTELAKVLGIVDARSAQSPEDKYAAVRSMQHEGRTVIMVGDGVNDAPVLGQAQVSVAMAQGADLARAHSDTVLLGNSLWGLVHGVRLARKTVAIVRQNLVWSVVYNAIALPFAMAGWITPWMAGIGMSASSLLVVLNALRLQREDGV